MIAEGLKYLAGLGRDALAPKIVTVGDREYATANLIPVKSPEPDVLRVYTLQAVVDYLTAGFDRLEVPVVHIEGPGDVLVTHPLEGKWRQRPAFVRAACPHDQFPWGRRMDQETFMTFLQSRFVDTVDRTELLRVMGNLRDELVTTMADDGVSQEVTVKSGISRVKQARVPNPVILRPFRTFSGDRAARQPVRGPPAQGEFPAGNQPARGRRGEMATGCCGRHPRMAHRKAAGRDGCSGMSLLIS